MRFLILCITALSLSACAQIDKKAAAPRMKPSAVAELKNKDSAGLGNAAIVQGKYGLQLDISLTGLAPGTYGMHLHEVGKCDGPDFKTAGMHWNPAGKQHGRDNPMGAHSGDMPNITVSADKKGSLSVALAGAQMEGLNGLLDTDGTSIIIHASADDFRTDPSGNSGARIICGVFNKANY
jgi:superoxide dismutase, Cu-Zn family